MASSLIVFFSRSGLNSDGVRLVTGYTHTLANIIRAETGADMFEIIPSVAYPDDYRETVARNQWEEDEDARPEIVGGLPSTDDYDTVFIGFPTWNMQLPMVMRTFLEGVDLNGKTVVPFNTNAGYGVGSAVRQIKRQWPYATVLREFAVKSTEGGLFSHSSGIVVAEYRTGGGR